MAPKATKTALSKAPGAKLAQNLQRVSPGVYRNASGQLTNSGGRPMPGQASRVPSPSVGAIQGATRGANAAVGGRAPAGRQRGVMEGIAQGIGGRNGNPRGMLEGAAQGMGAAFGGGMGGMPAGSAGMAGQVAGDYLEGMDSEGRVMGGGFGQGLGRNMNDMMQRFNGPKDPQTLQAEYQAFLEQQRATGAANMGEQFGGMAGGFAQGMGQGFGMGKGPAQPGLEDQARARAEAIARGDSVTMDYNPERERMVDQFLGQMGRGPAMNPQMQKPGTVSGLLQRGPAPRPNPFQNMMQGFGGKKPIPY